MSNKNNNKVSYYHTVFGRPARLKRFFMNLFLSLSYLFRVPIEVITRKDFGDRYFNILLSILIGVFFIAAPLFLCRGFGSPNTELISKYFGTWYVYTALYLYSVYQRYREVLALPSIWDVPMFTWSEGKPIPALLKIKIGNDYPTTKTMSLLIEPGIFFIAGVILTFMKQPIGLIFIICALIYSLGYMASYYLATDFMKDKGDEIICNEELSEFFLNGKHTEKGFDYDGPVPKDPKMRERMLREMLGGDAEDIDFEEVK
ncbi:MAG: hypothetical protein JST70_01885 [Bacteroidetes bacterium]|nr:hypothetical protein [Bacteroidota bacterium]